MSNCKKCGKRYKDDLHADYKWCKSCTINQLEGIYCTSGNEKIDNFILKRKLEINHYNDDVFEWIPYNQLDIEETSVDFAKVYLAKWRDGPLYYDTNKHEYTRYQQNKKVVLKYFSGSQNNIIEFLEKV